MWEVIEGYNCYNLNEKAGKGIWIVAEGLFLGINFLGEYNCIYPYEINLIYFILLLDVILSIIISFFDNGKPDNIVIWLLASGN